MFLPACMSNKQNVGATDLVARSNQEWYNCGGFNWGISIESKCGMARQQCMGDVYWTCIGPGDQTGRPYIHRLN